MDPQANDQHFHVGLKGHVLGVERATGAIAWKVRLPDAGLASGLVNLLVAQHRIYATCSRAVACLDAADGHVRWSTGVDKLGTPAALALDLEGDEPLLFIAAAGRLFAVAAESGELRWRNDLHGMGFDPISLRVPGAIVSQPLVRYVSTGQSVTIQPIETDQLGG